MNWKQYLLAVSLFSLICFLAVFAFLLLQGLLPGTHRSFPLDKLPSGDKCLIQPQCAVVYIHEPRSHAKEAYVLG